MGAPTQAGIAVTRAALMLLLSTAAAAEGNALYGVSVQSMTQMDFGPEGELKPARLPGIYVAYDRTSETLAAVSYDCYSTAHFYDLVVCAQNLRPDGGESQLGDAETLADAVRAAVAGQELILDPAATGDHQTIGPVTLAGAKLVQKDPRGTCIAVTISVNTITQFPIAN